MRSPFRKAAASMAWIQSVLPARADRSAKNTIKSGNPFFQLPQDAGGLEQNIRSRDLSDIETPKACFQQRCKVSLMPRHMKAGNPAADIFL